MDIGIIGGGASGCICAIKLKQNKDNNVTILEQNDRLLKKVLKTGNGKCNIMNNNISSLYYNDYSLIDNQGIDVYQELLDLGLVLKELTLGRVYPYSEQSKTVINVLLKNINKSGVNVILNEEVIDIKKIDNKFKVISNNNTYFFDKVIISTGSKSQEKTNGYELVKKMGLNVTNLSPGLVPLETIENTKKLSGLRVKAKTNISNHEFTGELLFKDDGISGILTLDISRFVSKGSIVSFDLMSEYSEEDIYKLLDKDNLLDSLEGIFPKMIAMDIIDRSNNDINNIPKTIKNYTFTIKDKKGFNDSQITLGGVDTKLVDRNFECKQIKGLFITGELLNVDGARWIQFVFCLAIRFKSK